MKPFVFLIAIILLTSCSIEKKNYKNSIVGKWTVDSMLNYNNGEEDMIRRTNNPNLFIGSNSNPLIFNYTKYKELFIYNKNDSDKRLTTYKILGDSIIHSSIVNSKIVILNKSKLVFQNEFKTIYFDQTKEHPKQIMTYYLTKISND